MLQRIAKMFAALCLGIGVTFVAQVALPPAFLHFYGVERYGEWLVLSAALSYLQTINFGITTYAGNELTMLHRRGEHAQYRELQASTLAMMLGIFAVGLLLCAALFLLPMNRILHLQWMQESETRWAAAGLGMQTILSMTFGYYNNLFMVVGKAHRGVNWYNARRLAPVVGALPAIALRASFAAVAMGQLAAMLLVALLTLVDLKRCLGDLPLGIRGASWRAVRKSLLPSGMFGLAHLHYWLLYQGPVLVLQWVLGPTAVVVFAVGRTILSIARQLLTTLTDALKPEITTLYAAGERRKLLSLFHNSEKIMYFVIPATNMGIYLFSPLILRLWVHRSGLFNIGIYGMLAVISCAISMREHKQFFHYATNTHHRYALIVFWGNLAMVLCSVPATIWLGVRGLLGVWLISEVVQMMLTYAENRRLFQQDSSITLQPALRLLLVMGGSFALCAGLLRFTLGGPWWQMAIAGLLGTALIACVSFYLFRVRDVWSIVAEWVQARFAARTMAA